MYIRDLVEFTKEEIMEMCPKKVVGIFVPSRDDDNRLMEPQIIKLEFEKEILDPNIIIGEENIRLQMKKERPTF